MPKYLAPNAAMTYFWGTTFCRLRGIGGEEYMHLRNLAITLSLIAMVAGCGQGPYPPDVAASLKAAGENRGELERVLAYYRDSGDSLKLKAAYYLIGNMEEHSYVTYRLVDTAGTEVEFNVLDYPDYDSLLAAARVIEKQRGEFDYEKDDKILDLETISAEFLIDQIDLAFKAWREKPWAKNLSFENFCNFVLPYRGSNEPLEPWRETFWDKYADIESKMSDPSDPLEAAKLINDEITSWFKFDPRFYYHPTDQGLAEMFDNKLGRCEDMTNLTIYAMRANGLAVTSDYTPAWADCGNNHAWNAIVTADGRVVPFMGAECNPGEYNLGHKFAKVYRKSFAENKDNLIFQERKQEEVPRWLGGRSYIDVTADYGPVCEVTVAFEQEIPDSVDIAYLCVFNSGEWKAIDWGRIEGDSVIFTDMAMDIAYLPALYLNEEIVPFGSPLVLNKDCGTTDLYADEEKPITVKLSSTVPRKKEAKAGKSFLTPGQEYELFYMADDWQSLGTAVAGDGPLEFTEVPGDGLYWLVATDSDKEERIFTIEDGRQVWW